MNILNSKAMMHPQKLGEVTPPGTPQSQTGPLDPMTDSFPTLLNIPWQEEPELPAQPTAGTIDGGKSPKVELPLPEQTLSKTESHVGKEPAEPPESVGELPGGELAKAIAHVLALNSNLSISVNVETSDDLMIEKERLIDRYQQVSASGTAPVFSWSPHNAPNLNKTGPAAVSLSDFKQTSALGQFGQNSMNEARQTLASPQPSSGHSERPSIPSNHLASDASRPVMGAASTTHAANTHGQPQTPTNTPLVETALNKAAQTEAMPKALPEVSGRNSTEGLSATKPVHIEAVRRVENQIPFFQLVTPSRVSELVTRVATGLQTSASTEMPDTGTAIQPSTKAVARIEVQLVPKNLGKVLVSVQKQDGAISVLIRTETAEAERILANESTSIREALKGAGLALDEIRIQQFGAFERETDLRHNRHSDQDSFFQGAAENAEFDEHQGAEQMSSPEGSDQDKQSDKQGMNLDTMEAETRHGLYL